MFGPRDVTAVNKRWATEISPRIRQGCNHLEASPAEKRNVTRHEGRTPSGQTDSRGFRETPFELNYSGE